MKCIDALEGTLKCVISQLHKLCIENRLDDSEYIRMIKALIDATEQHLRVNPEIAEDPLLLKRELYCYSRNLWLAALGAELQSDEPRENDDDEPQEYQTYYFDYLYHRGIYPQ